MFASGRAEVAQLVEQPIRNRQVSGSIPLLGSNHLLSLENVAIGQWGRTFGGVARSVQVPSFSLSESIALT
jgi:hypothetical protein